MLATAALLAALLAATAATTAAGMSITPGAVLPITSASNPAFALRHCNYVLSANPDDGSDDFRFVIVASQNGAAPPAYSLQSENYPTMRWAIVNATSGALGLVEGANADDATFEFLPPLGACAGNATGCVSLRSASRGPFAGQYVTWAETRNMPCAYPAPCGDAVLAPGGTGDPARATWLVTRPPPASVTVDVHTVVNGAVSPLIMGCHSDYGAWRAPVCSLKDQRVVL